MGYSQIYYISQSIASSYILNKTKIESWVKQGNKISPTKVKHWFSAQANFTELYNKRWVKETACVHVILFFLGGKVDIIT